MLSDFDKNQSALCPISDSKDGALFFQQGSDLNGLYDLLWASNDVIKSNMSKYIETGPLFFNAEHALAKVYFVVEGLNDRSENRATKPRA